MRRLMLDSQQIVVSFLYSHVGLSGYFVPGQSDVEKKPERHFSGSIVGRKEVRKMKKILLFCLILLSAFLLTACGNENELVIEDVRRSQSTSGDIIATLENGIFSVHAAGEGISWLQVPLDRTWLGDRLDLYQYKGSLYIGLHSQADRSGTYVLISMYIREGGEIAIVHGLDVFDEPPAHITWPDSGICISEENYSLKICIDLHDTYGWMYAEQE